MYNGKHKIYHVKAIQIVTAQSLEKLRDEEKNKPENVLNELPTLCVHFEKGLFREIDKWVNKSLKIQPISINSFPDW